MQPTGSAGCPRAARPCGRPPSTTWSAPAGLGGEHALLAALELRAGLQPFFLDVAARAF